MASKKQKLSDYKEPNYYMDNINIDFDLYDDHCLVTCKSELSIRTDKSSQFLNAKDLELVEVKLDNKKLTAGEDYNLSDEGMLLKNLKESHCLEIITKIYPHKNKSLEGLYKTSDFYCTQNEAQGFRRISCFIDRPDNLASYQVHIRADKNKFPVLLSNGDKIAEKDLENNRHMVSWKDPHKKPCYLFALVAGNLEKICDTYTTKSGRKVSLEIYSEEKYLDRLQFAMQSLKDSMKWDEDRYGLEYDLDTYMIVVSDDFNAGAMENKGLNIFNSKYVLASPETATENSYYLIQSVIGHEYFHNWSGNRVTCRDWFQLSLKEGLTVYRDQEFTSDLNSRSVKRIEDVKTLRSRQFPEDNGPNSHPVRPEEVVSIDNFYSATVYEKGAEIIRMYHSLLGESCFNKGLEIYFKKFDGMAVTCDDFCSCMEEASGKDLSHFKKWYSQSGTPRVSVNESWDESKKTLTVQWRQTNPPTNNQKEKQALVIPVALSFFDLEGESLVPKNIEALTKQDKDFLYILDSEQQTLTLQFEREALGSYFRNFSAPVIIDREINEERLLLLAKHDDDAFNQFEAIEQLKQQHMLSLYKGESKSPMHINALKILLENYAKDPAFVSLCLQAPHISYFLLSEENWNYEQLKQSGILFSKQIAKELTNELLETYLKLEEQTKGKIGLEFKGLKDLKNVCLFYIGLSGHPDAHRLSEEQYKDNPDQTNRLGAMLQRRFSSAFTPSDELFEHFKQSWKNDKLVINEYIRLLCGSGYYLTQEFLDNLWKEDFFDSQNPNNLYSAIGGFVTNFNHFHDNWNWSYSWFAARVLEIDKFNSQVAGRLFSSLESWNKFDDKRSKKMRDTLEELSKKDISNNLREIVENNLKLGD